jgi:hypothetical protein
MPSKADRWVEVGFILNLYYSAFKRSERRFIYRVFHEIIH